MQWNCEILPKLSSRSNLRRRLRIFHIYSRPTIFYLLFWHFYRTCLIHGIQREFNSIWKGISIISWQKESNSNEKKTISWIGLNILKECCWYQIVGAVDRLQCRLRPQWTLDPTVPILHIHLCKMPPLPPPLPSPPCRWNTYIVACWC